MLYFLTVNDLAEDERFKIVKEYFPKLSVKNHYLDKHLLSSKLEMYVYYKAALGLSTMDAANAVELNSVMFDKAYEGEGVSIDKLLELVELELYTYAATKAEHYKNLERNSSSEFRKHRFPDDEQTNIPDELNFNFRFWKGKEKQN